jgi:hypothetical protein
MIESCFLAAKNMGFTISPPAYLSLVRISGRHLVRSALGTGELYASAGAGILDSTVCVLPCSSRLE